MEQVKSTELSIPQTFNINNTELNKKTLIEKRTEDVKLIIKDVNDTASYKLANKLRGEYRTVRTSLEKIRKDLSKPHQEYVKQLKTATDELGAEALIGEQYFDQLMADIDAEKQRIKDEEAKQEQIRIQVRIKQLTDLGAKWDTDTYFFTYCTGLSIDAVSITEYTDGDFADFLADVKTEWDVEQQRLEDERLQKIEDDKKAKELADAVTAQAEANKTAQDALAAKQTKLRIKELTMLGGTIVDEGDWSFHNGVKLISQYAIENAGDSAWDDLIESIENYVAPEPEIEEDISESFNDGIIGNTGYQPESGYVASGNPVEQPQESYVTNEAGPIDETLPLSTFYLEEVNDFSSENIPDEKTFKDWVSETLIDDVRENTPHGECGDSENTLLFKWDGKFWEGHISNIEWGRHDKQFYFIDMYGAPKITLKEVRLPSGPKPILTANETLAFNLQEPFDDFNVSMKLKMRIYPDAYAEQAMAGVGSVGNSGKVQGLNWALISRS